jgi:xylulokinase
MDLIGLDIGTTGCKAIIFDVQGKPLGQAFRDYGTICDQPAKAEQDAEAVWRLAKDALREAVLASGVKDICALSVSVQGDAIIPVDAQFRALHPAILGMDYRSAPQAAACAEQFGDFSLFQLTGMRAHPMNSLAKVLFLREREADVFARAWKIVTYADFVLGKCGGEAVIDHTMASRTMAFDLKAKAWSREILNRLDLREDLLSKAVPSGTVVGTIQRSLAAELNLPPGLLLVAGGHDQTCAALGAGMVNAGLGLASTGTAEVFSTAFEKPTLTRRMFDSFYPCYLHAKPGMFFTFALSHVGGILLRWWRDQFAGVEAADARAARLDPYELIIQRMPSGPSPVFVVPHLNGTGTPWCDLDAKGAILGLNLSTTRHDVAKALLEGLAFELRINLENMQSCGVDIQRLAAVGGAAKSALWLQLKADILNRPIATLRCREAACLGAALLAGVGARVYHSFEEAVAQMVAADREYVPQTGLSRQYNDRFAEYSRLYPALKQLNARTDPQNI